MAVVGAERKPMAETGCFRFCPEADLTKAIRIG